MVSSRILLGSETSNLEPEGRPDRGAPEVEAAELEVDVVAAVGVAYAAEVTQVGAQPDVLAHQGMDAAADIDAEAVLVDVEDVVGVAEPRADQAGAGDGQPGPRSRGRPKRMRCGVPTTKANFCWAIASTAIP